MDMRPARQKTIFSNYRFWIVNLCFLMFGILLPFTKPFFSIVTFTVSVTISLIFALTSVSLLVVIFNNLNPHLSNVSQSSTQDAVARGMLFMIPFTVLAVLAKFGLGWDAIMPFLSSGITTAMASSGSEIMKEGGRGAKNLILPSIFAFLISTIWMLILSILP